jgi:hypothetical protein
MVGRCCLAQKWTKMSHSEGLDFNRSNLSTTDINAAINALMDAAALVEQREERRTYLGASGIGSECLRRVQYDWQCDSVHAARTKRIFSRGHMFEEITVKALGQAGFRMERGTAATHFSAAEDLFKGHADGIIVAGPDVLKYPCLFEHKALGSSGWKKIEKYGLAQGLSAVFRPVPALHGLPRAGRKPGSVQRGQLGQLRDPASARAVRRRGSAGRE